jgi:hypothetical protein
MLPQLCARITVRACRAYNRSTYLATLIFPYESFPLVSISSACTSSALTSARTLRFVLERFIAEAAARGGVGTDSSLDQAEAGARAGNHSNSHLAISGTEPVESLWGAPLSAPTSADHSSRVPGMTAGTQAPVLERSRGLTQQSRPWLEEVCSVLESPALPVVSPRHLLLICCPYDALMLLLVLTPPLPHCRPSCRPVPFVTTVRSQLPLSSACVFSSHVSPSCR